MRACGSWDEYARKFPQGFTQDAARTWVARLRGTESPRARPVNHDDVLDAPALGLLKAHHLLPPGLAGRLTKILATITGTPCACRVCTDHHEAHEQQQRTIAGHPVNVDTAMLPLLDPLLDAGVRTVASCIDIADAVKRLDPDKWIPLHALDGPGLHYGDITARRLAFVRVVEEGTATHRFLARASAMPDVIVTREDFGGRSVAQVAFPAADIELLAGAVQ